MFSNKPWYNNNNNNPHTSKLEEDFYQQVLSLSGAKIRMKVLQLDRLLQIGSTLY